MSRAVAAKVGCRRARAAGALLAVLVIGGCAQGPDFLVGRPVPPFSLPALDGGLAGPAAWRGRTVVLNVWATWCPPCREEIPSLQRLSDQLGEERFLVVGLSVDRDANLVREFALRYGIDFPLLLDAERAVAEGLLGATGYPLTFLVAPDGRVVERVYGGADWSSPEYVARVRAASG